MHWWIWAGAAVLYAAFRAWYDNRRGPLTPAEIDRHFARLATSPTAGHNDLDLLRAFCEKDDGREFVMLNLVKIAGGEAVHPTTGAVVPARELMDHYTRHFVPATLKRAGHPVLVGRKTGGYVDAWGVPADPGWTIFGSMRYRSRRDMLELVTDPLFFELHPFKIAGTEQTFSFPTRLVMATYLGPRAWVALVLVAAAALAQVALLLAH